MAGTVKGRRFFWRSSPATRRRSIRSSGDVRMGGLARLQGRADSGWDERLFDLAKAAASKTYCDEIDGTAKSHGLAITELSTHLQGQLVAVHPAYDEAFDAFAPKEMHGKPKERQHWAVEQMLRAAQGVATSRPDGRIRPSPARSPGRISIPGRSVRRA